MFFFWELKTDVQEIQYFRFFGKNDPLEMGQLEIGME